MYAIRSYYELLEDTKTGIFLKGSRGGQVDTGKGLFQFNAVEAFLIENGQLTKPLRDAGLSGEILDILHHVDAVSNEFELSVGYVITSYSIHYTKLYEKWLGESPVRYF